VLDHTANRAQPWLPVAQPHCPWSRLWVNGEDPFLAARGVVPRQPDPHSGPPRALPERASAGTRDRAAAEQSYHQALAVAERQSAKQFELRAATSLARLWRDQGKRTEARDLLAPVYGWFTEGFDTPVLQEAKTLLEKLTA